MIDKNFSYTTAVLGLLNNLKDEKVRSNELAEDRAFKFAINKYAQEAEANMRMNEMRVQATVNSLAALDTEESKWRERAVTYGKMLENVTSPGAVQVFMDKTKEIKNKVGSIQEQKDTLSQQMAVARMASTDAQARINSLMNYVSEYQRGATDEATVSEIMKYANITGKDAGVAQWTTEPNELEQALEISKDEKLKSLLEPYLIPGTNKLDESKAMTKGMRKLLAEVGTKTIDQQTALMKANADMLNAKANMLSSSTSNAGKLDTRTEARERTIGTEQGKAIVSLQEMSGSSEMLADTFKQYYTIKSSLKGPIGGIRGEVESALGISSEASAYNAWKDAISSTLAKTYGKDVGMLSNQDIKKALKMLPGLRDKDETATIRTMNFVNFIDNTVKSKQRVAGLPDVGINRDTFYAKVGIKPIDAGASGNSNSDRPEGMKP